MNDTITIQREVIERAISALERCYDVESYPSDGSTQQDAALNELRAALAQQAEPPIKFRHGCQWCGKQNCTTHTQVAQQADEKSILNNSVHSTIYTKGHADGRKDAMADIRELLGITNGSLDL